LEPVPSEGDEEEEARLAKARALLTAALAEECRKQAQVEALEQQLLKDYPHGLPVRKDTDDLAALKHTSSTSIWTVAAVQCCTGTVPARPVGEK
jgi:hypothetical protein